VSRKIQKYDFKEGLPQEFEIINLSQLFEKSSGKLTTPHRAEFYQILWFQEGNPTHLVDFNPVEIRPNTILFLNKSMVQQFDHSGNFDGQVILFTDSFFCKTESDTKYLKSSILFNDLLSISKIHLSKLSSLFMDFFQLLKSEFSHPKDDYQPDILRNYLHNFLLLAERERRKQDFTEVKKGANLDYVVLFKDLLENQFREHFYS